jgi:hypothetical protein
MSSRFDDALARIDRANSADPNVVKDGGEEIAKELLYSRRMSQWLDNLYPDAGEELRLAVRAQHIGRWKIPRGDFPEGRAGYKKWRSTLMVQHAAEAAEHLSAAGYAPESVERVTRLIRKQGLKTNPDTQALEDVVCLVFLNHYFEEFAAKHERAKLVDIVAKTWKKMSPRAREAAAQLPLPDNLADIVGEAIG